MSLVFAKLRLLSLIVIGMLFSGASSSAVDYDNPRFDKIARAIDSDKHKLLDRSLDDVTKLLGLEKVPWDKGYTNYPTGERRIYHFRGFYLELHLVLLPPGIKPHSKASYSLQNLEQTGVRWLGAFNPFVHADGITDPKERMKVYWDAVGKGFEQRAKILNKVQGRRPPSD